MNEEESVSPPSDVLNFCFPNVKFATANSDHDVQRGSLKLETSTQVDSRGIFSQIRLIDYLQMNAVAMLDRVVNLKASPEVVVSTIALTLQVVP